MGKDLGAVRKEGAKVRKKSWMRRQIVREEQGLLSKDVCSSALLILLWKTAVD